MCLLLSAKSEIKICHTFLEPGDAYMEVDSMHALIEKKARRREFFDTDAWVNHIRAVKVNGAKYEVNVVEQDHFLDFKRLVALQNWDTDTTHCRVKWSKVRQVRVDPQQSNVVFFRYEYRGEEFTMNTNSRRGRPVSLKSYKLLEKS